MYHKRTCGDVLVLMLPSWSVFAAAWLTCLFCWPPYPTCYLYILYQISCTGWYDLLMHKVACVLTKQPCAAKSMSRLAGG
jgi:hypothetical protein